MNEQYPHRIHRTLTVEDIERDNKDTADRLDKIGREFKKGFEFIKKYQKTVSIYGSARFDEGNIHYQSARRVAGRIAKELGCAIVTGGGPGIMEAANRGAKEAGGDSLGLNITLSHEQNKNPYLTDSIEFYYFFVRKVILSFSAEAYLFFPGGFGTLDEFFEIATLVQTKKIQRIPIILVGKDYWEPLRSMLEENLLHIHRSIDKADLNLITITDNEDEIMEIVKNAPMREHHSHDE